MKSTQKHKLLESVELELLTDDPTPELRKQATQLVFGHGNVDASIVIIGEAPGKKEDETGQPFVGASGKMLDQLLDSVGLKRDDIYITNIVKYRPPNNRDPKKSEKEAMWPYLVEQLRIIKPKVVVTLGRHSGAHFVADLEMSRDHGQTRAVSGILEGNDELNILTLYHPAAALYNGSLRDTLFIDFQTVADFI